MTKHRISTTGSGWDCDCSPCVRGRVQKIYLESKAFKSQEKWRSGGECAKEGKFARMISATEKEEQEVSYVQKERTQRVQRAKVKGGTRDQLVGWASKGKK